jgi:hypothetical protein
MKWTIGKQRELPMEMIFGNTGVSVCLIFGILFLPTVVLSSSVFSSFANAQNSVSSKPLVGWGWISNWWKDRRIIQVFGIHLKARIPTKQRHNLFFFRRCNLYRNEVFNSPVIFRKSLLLIRWPVEVLEWTVGNLRESSFTLVIRS